MDSYINKRQSIRIDCSRLTRIDPIGVHIFKTDDKPVYFFRVPIEGMTDCAISTMGQLIRRIDNGWMMPDLKPRLDIRSGIDYFYAWTDQNHKRRRIGITEIMRKTFFPTCKSIVWHGDTPMQRRNKSLGSGTISKLRPIFDVTKFYLIQNDYRSEYVQFMRSIFDRTYQTPQHELINIPDLPPRPKRDKPPTPPYLDDGTPLEGAQGLTIDRINSTYYWMLSRATNENYKNREDKVRYRSTQLDPAWASRVNFQHWMQANYYYYPDSLELDKDIFGLCRANTYGPQYCCFIPKYLNQIFTSKKNMHPDKTYYGYGIQRLVRKTGNIVYSIATEYDERTGFSASGMTYDSYSDALREGRRRKAEKIRAIVRYERERGYIPEGILSQLQIISELIETGKFDLYEPEIQTIEESRQKACAQC